MANDTDTTAQVVVPYLLHKLHQHFIHLVSEDDHGGIGYISPQEDLMHFIKFLFLNAYPYLQSAWEVGVVTRLLGRWVWLSGCWRWVGMADWGYCCLVLVYPALGSTGSLE